ncbi:hypothetical protein EC843_1011022 [Buttiauxella sp. JUb87]|uniref:hypothetical protein n=1 Tax=Buttiauxella sp. JUb87 TaxID=2485129 RepID=UPI00105DAAA1|nr:hypothetical protein [Buttiauxella sp. JUb87]TDN54963.1 hypothetical protein EC843_1011022 [Buttiauxella sp. JUb87]
MTTNRMGLEQVLSDERLEEVANIGSVDQMAFPPSHTQCAAMARELLAYRKASKEPIGEVCLGEYDDSGSHPDARVVCLHSHADWNNFTDGFKLFSTPPPQAVPVPDEWTDAQCLEFLTVAFRHNRIKGDIEFNDIRLGVKMANDYRPPKSVTNEP